MTATCTNPACPENGVGKPCAVTPRPGEIVQCGECGKPCVLSES